MIPEIYDIAIKDILTIKSDKTLEEAIKKMASSNLRTILIEDVSSYKIFTTSRLIDFKLENIDTKTLLKNLSLKDAKIVNKNFRYQYLSIK